MSTYGRVGAGVIPPSQIYGAAELANINSWIDYPLNSEYVGYEGALVYSHSVGSLIFSLDGYNWSVVGSGQAFGSDTSARNAIGWPYTNPDTVDERLIYLENFVIGEVDGEARTAIGWPYTNPVNINDRLVALENAGVTEPISAPDGIQAGPPAPTTSTPAPLTGRQIESLSGLPYEYSALDLWPKDGEYRVRFWAPNLSHGIPGFGVIGLSAIYFSNDILISAYDVLEEMGGAVYKQVPTLSVRNAIEDQIIVKSTDSNVLYPTSFSENSYVSTKTQLTRNSDGSFTCAANGRVFQVSYQIAWQSEATGLRYAWIEKNDGTVYAMNIANPINGDVTIQSGTSTLTLDSGESFSIKCKHTCAFDISLINETSVAGIPAGYTNTVCISML